jgi:hypothetical protein
MGFRDLVDMGVADALERGAEVISERGLTKGLRVDPVSKSVDPVAALALGLGAPIKTVYNSCSLTDLGVPPVKEVALLLAVESLEAILDQPLEEWSDSFDVKSEDVENLFRTTAVRLRIAII